MMHSKLLILHNPYSKHHKIMYYHEKKVNWQPLASLHSQLNSRFLQKFEYSETRSSHQDSIQELGVMKLSDTKQKAIDSSLTDL